MYKIKSSENRSKWNWYEGRNNYVILQNILLKYWNFLKSGHLSTFLALWVFIEFVSYRFWEHLHNLHHCVAILRLLPVAVYVVLIILLRYHLFVWTVFSPKLLYEGMHTLVISLLMLLINFVASTVVKDVKWKWVINDFIIINHRHFYFACHHFKSSSIYHNSELCCTSLLNIWIKCIWIYK